MSFESNAVCRFGGPLATEVFAVCRPVSSEAEGIFPQTQEVYGSMESILQSAGGSWEHVQQEWVHFRRIREAMPRFLQARRARVAGRVGRAAFAPASTFIEQPPLDRRLSLELAFHAVIPAAPGAQALSPAAADSSCACGECTPPTVRLMTENSCRHLHAGGFHGAAGPAYQEAYSMYRKAQQILGLSGMSFHDVVRTWIYLRDIGRDYAAFNRARRDFYRELGLNRLPASTGIAGAPLAARHNFLMSLHAVRTPGPLASQVMTTPTLNEAPAYGSDFSRGLRVADDNKITLFLSGTASVDEHGSTAHPGDLPGQIDRMLLNISTLLEGQDATTADLVLATCYLKDPDGAETLREALRSRGLDRLPGVMVHAAVCRQDLLCEMEAIAVLPLLRK